MSEPEKPKKISSDQIEVIDARGQVIQESKEHGERPRSQGPFGSSVRVFQGSPLMLLFLPVVLPLILIVMFFVLIFAIFFGRTAFRILKWKN